MYESAIALGKASRDNSVLERSLELMDAAEKHGPRTRSQALKTVSVLSGRLGFWADWPISVLRTTLKKSGSPAFSKRARDMVTVSRRGHEATRRLADDLHRFTESHPKKLARLRLRTDLGTPHYTLPPRK